MDVRVRVGVNQMAFTRGRLISISCSLNAANSRSTFARGATPQSHALGAESQQQSQSSEGQQLHPDVDESPVSNYVQEVPQPVDLPKKSGLSSPGSKLVLGLAALAGTTFIIALFRVLKRSNDPKVKQQRLGRKNKLVVESLAEYLPQRRHELSSKHARRLCTKTGFKPEEIFRKYLWYLLKERSFDRTALDDIVHLKQVLNLSDSQVTEAIYARAERINKRYGAVMLQTDGMTTAGVERKATTRALFSKLLYLTEYEPLCGRSVASGEEEEKASISRLFGITEEDARELRIGDVEEGDLQ